MYFQQKPDFVDQNLIRRNQLQQERIEIEELQQNFQNEGDKLIQKFMDFNTSFEDVKANLKKETKQLKEENQNYFIQLEKNVQNLKNFYLEKFEIIQQRIRMLQELSQKINDYHLSKDLYLEFITIQQKTNISNDQDDRNSWDQLQIARLLLNLFIPLKETTLANECICIIQKTIFNLALLQINGKIEEKDDIKINLICEEHQDRIIVLDLIQKQPRSSRLGCQTCVNLNSEIQYQSIQQIQNQWKEMYKKKLNTMLLNYAVLKNKIFYIQEFFQLIKNKTLISLEQANTKLNTSYNKYTQAILDLNQKMQKPWINALQINYLNFYEDPYTNEDSVLNQLAKESLRNLHEYLLMYTNKIIPLIANFTTFKQENQDLFRKNQKQFNSDQFSEQQLNLNQQTQKNNQNNIGLKTQEDCKNYNNQELEECQKESKKLIYELKQEASIKQSEPCYAIAINKDSQLLAASCGKTTRVFEFIAGLLKQLQILAEHINVVFALSFMKISNQLISCGHNSIIIWSINQNNLWECKEKLEGHVSFIRCVLINKNDDLIISGSDDMTIKFWHKQYQWFCQQTINDHKNRVLALSINEQQNKLISCSEDNSILIIESSESDRRWVVKQRIVVEQYGLRLCFINDDLFAFQPNNRQQMHIYQIQNDQILKKSEIDLKNSQDSYSLFSQQYIQAKCLLFNKNGFYVHIIRQKDNNQFIVEQSISFGIQNVYGAVTDDGQYLITRDSLSKAIQVRMYMEK